MRLCNQPRRSQYRGDLTVTKSHSAHGFPAGWPKCIMHQVRALISVVVLGWVSLINCNCSSTCSPHVASFSYSMLFLCAGAWCIHSDTADIWVSSQVFFVAWNCRHILFYMFYFGKTPVNVFGLVNKTIQISTIWIPWGAGREGEKSNKSIWSS